MAITSCSLRRVVCRLLQMSTTADGVGAPWSTSREKTYKKVKNSTRSLVLRHTSPHGCPSAAHHVMALDKDQSHLFFISKLQTSLLWDFLTCRQLKCFPRRLFRLRRNTRQWCVCAAFPHSRSASVFMAFFFHAQDSQNCRPKVTVVRRKWIHSPIFLQNSVASDYNGDSSDSIL